MGIYDREYYRDDRYDSLAKWYGNRGTVGLIVVNSLLFLLQMMTRPGGGIAPDAVTQLMAFDVSRILSGEVWRLVTASFLHSTTTPFHILFNMLVLYWFGVMIEGVYGTREFLGFYFTAILFGSSAELLIRASGLANPNITSIGASGPVTAVLVLFALHYPYKELRLMFILPVPAWLVVCLIIAVDFFGLVGGAGRTNHLAHLLGAGFAFLYFFLQIRVTNWIPVLRQRLHRTTHPRLRIYQTVDGEAPPPRRSPTPGPTAKGNTSSSDTEQLEAQLDQVLAKVAREGRESLSAAEQEILMRASEIYKQRRHQ